MQTLNELRSLLAEHGVHPTPGLGQNFLVDQNLLRKLVDAANVEAGELALEVGPGAGALTEALLDRGCRVVACEIDAGLANLLDSTLVQRAGDRLTLIHGDCLAGKRAVNPKILEALGDEPFKLVSNLPYNIASPLIATLLIHHPRCEALHITVQKEVADRLSAPPGGKEYGELSVITQSLAMIERLATVPPQCFWPRPKVTSAMLSVVRRAEPLIEDAVSLEAFCRRLFATRRKQLAAILRDLDQTPTRWPVGVEPTHRPEQLSVEQIIELMNLVEQR